MRFYFCCIYYVQEWSLCPTQNVQLDTYVKPLLCLTVSVKHLNTDSYPSRQIDRTLLKLPACRLVRVVRVFPTGAGWGNDDFHLALSRLLRQTGVECLESILLPTGDARSNAQVFVLTHDHQGNTTEEMTSPIFLVRKGCRHF